MSLVTFSSQKHNIFVAYCVEALHFRHRLCRNIALSKPLHVHSKLFRAVTFSYWVQNITKKIYFCCMKYKVKEIYETEVSVTFYSDVCFVYFSCWSYHMTDTTIIIYEAFFKQIKLMELNEGNNIMKVQPAFLLNTVDMKVTRWARSRLRNIIYLVSMKKEFQMTDRKGI